MRQNADKVLLDRKAQIELYAKLRARKKLLIEAEARKTEEFREEYGKMIRSEQHISSPRSLMGTATKKKSVLE